MSEVDMHHVLIAAIEESCFAIMGEVDQLVRQHEFAGQRAANAADRCDGQDFGGASRLQRPQVGAVVDPVGRDGVPMPVPGKKHHVAAGDLSKHQRLTKAHRRACGRPRGGRRRASRGA
jgi:hypothetical protein